VTVPSLGYADPCYAASLAEFGTIRRLPASGGAVVVRPLPTGGDADAIGPYPVFDCLDWSALATDVDGLRGELVSLVIVTDPFADDADAAVRAAGADLLRPYKPHFVVDLATPPDEIGRPSRRRTAERALDGLDVAATSGSAADPQEWVRLYEHVVRRHAVTGIAAFSATSLAAQLALPGAELLTARHRGELVAAQLCLRRGGVVHSHLAASSPEGYRLRAMHGLDLFALGHFAVSARWFDFGGGSGGPDDGLADYKRSWSTGTRQTWLGGWVLDRAAYERAAGPAAIDTAGYFPRYRDGSRPGPR
jgi:hypothetical protein